MNWRQILLLDLLSGCRRFDSDARCLMLKDTDQQIQMEKWQNKHLRSKKVEWR